MNLFDFFKKESAVSAKPVIFMSSLAGIANASILFIINSVGLNPSSGDLKFRYLGLFVVTFLILIISKNYSLRHTTIIIEKMLAQLRLRILDKARTVDLKQIEDIGPAEIHTKLTHNINAISQTAIVAITVCQSLLMLFFCSLYVAWLSLPVFLVSVSVIGLSILFYNRRQKEAYGFLQESLVIQQDFFNKINGLLLGFKELKQNKKRNDSYFEDIEGVAYKNENIMIETQLKFVTGMMLAEITFYSLIAMVMFLMPRMGFEPSSNVPRLITSILFIMGPVVSIVGSMPLITQSNVAIAEIYGLEQQLDLALEPGESSIVKKADFKEVSLENIDFKYKGQYENNGFSLENVNLTVSSGELLFIVGGNGSGKSTLLKILTGLYNPDSGNIRLNGKVVNRANYQSYRELYSTIFTDFHLFEKLYGLDLIDHEKLSFYLERMELDEKTSYTDDRFTSIMLSTGQKKRLAMVIALLYDSDIYVFDELAADQAPEFRKYFYEILLKELQKLGKTIVVVSHDDRFFHLADRVLKMDYGKFVKV